MSLKASPSPRHQPKSKRPEGTRPEVVKELRKFLRGHSEKTRRDLGLPRTK